jgi:hypothetical protein
LRESSTGFIRQTPHLRISDVPSAAIRQFHKQSLDRAQTALEEQAASTRYFSSVMIPFDNRRVSEVGSQIEKFRDSMNKQESNTQGNSVYQFCISFFRVDASESETLPPELSQ